MLFIETDFHLDIKVIFSIDPWFYLNINEKREKNMRKLLFPSEMRKFHWFYNTLNPQFYAIIFLILLLEFWFHIPSDACWKESWISIWVFWIHSNSNQIQLARLGSKIVCFFKLTPRLYSHQSQCNGSEFYDCIIMHLGLRTSTKNKPFQNCAWNKCSCY